MRSVRPSPMLALIGAMLCVTTMAPAAEPTPARSLEDVLGQTAAVIEASVADVSYQYDDVEGPRTVATLNDIVVHMGEAFSKDTGSLELRSFGGFLPDGSEMSATHVPRLAHGERYLVFLRNTDWALSPIAFEHAFRVVKIGAARGLVDPYGRLVAGLGHHGVVPGPEIFARPQGGLDPARPERFAVWVTEAHVARALDPIELVGALRSFAEATAIWPSGAFSRAPAVNSASPWRRVATTPVAAPPSPSTDGVPACFDPSLEPKDTDATPNDAEMCIDGGAL
jgi:hypothetical protein